MNKITCEELSNLYLRDRLSYREIALKTGTRIDIISKLIKSCNIKPRSFSTKGLHSWNAGKKMSVESREKLSKTRKSLGIKLTKDQIEKLRLARGNQKGSNNYGWKGGKSRTGDGYVLVRMPNHPKAYSNGYIKRATLVVEKSLGRYLSKNEVIHHINGIKNDDRIENLIVLTNSKHVKLHRKKEIAVGIIRLYGDKGVV